MDEGHAHEFQSRARRAGRTQTPQDERERPTKQQRTTAPKSVPPNRRRHEQTAPMGGCYFLPFFLLALLAAGGSRLSSERLRLSSRRCRLRFISSSWAFKLSTQAARQLAKRYSKIPTLGEPLLLEFFTAACLNRQTKAWTSPVSGRSVGSLLATLQPDAVTGGSPTRPWSVEGVGPASNLRFAVPPLSPLLSAK